MARHRDSKGRFVKRHSSTVKLRRTRGGRRKTFGSRTTKVARRSRRRYSTAHLARASQSTRTYHRGQSALGGKSHVKPLLMVLGVVAGIFVFTKMRASAAAPAPITAGPPAPQTGIGPTITQMMNSLVPGSASVAV